MNDLPEDQTTMCQIPSECEMIKCGLFSNLPLGCGTNHGRRRDMELLRGLLIVYKALIVVLLIMAVYAFIIV